MTAGRQHLVTFVAALAGTVLFVYALRRVGVAEILGGIRRVGWGLAAVAALAGLRFMVRAECWRLCMPPRVRLPFGRAFGAFVAGDALGTITPLGLLASEPTKVFLTRHHLVTRDSVGSLALENLAYAGSVLIMIALGGVALISIVPMPRAWQVAAAGIVAALIAVAILSPRLLRRALDGNVTRESGWPERLRRLGTRAFGFSSDNRVPLLRVFLLELTFHALAVLEVFLTLRWLLGGRSPSLAQAAVFEAMNRVLIVAFKFVPLRVGVDEAFSAALAPLLAVDPAAGVALAVVRKVRNLAWAILGLCVIATHPARDKGAGGRG